MTDENLNEAATSRTAQAQPGSGAASGPARWLNFRIVVPAMFILMDMWRLLTIQDRGHWLVILSVFMLPFWTMMLVLGIQRRAQNSEVSQDAGRKEKGIK